MFSTMDSIYPLSALAAFRLLPIFCLSFLLLAESGFLSCIHPPVHPPLGGHWRSCSAWLSPSHVPALLPALRWPGSLPPLPKAPRPTAGSWAWTTPSAPVQGAGRACGVKERAQDRAQFSGSGLGPASGTNPKQVTPSLRFSPNNSWHFCQIVSKVCCACALLGLYCAATSLLTWVLLLILPSDHPPAVSQHCWDCPGHCCPFRVSDLPGRPLLPLSATGHTSASPAGENQSQIVKW